MGLLGGLIDNILPPLSEPPAPKKEEEPVGQKLVKIPVVMK